MGAWAAVLGLSGAITGRVDLSESGERGVHAASVFALLSAAGLAWALASGDLTYRYVASWVSYGTPLPYRIGAVWAGPTGALLLWAVALGLGATVATSTLRRGTVLRSWTGALLALLLLAVLAMASLDVNPFLRLPFPPEDGRGQPLEWMRPVALVQMPLGYCAMALLAVPSVMTVMGALGTTAWRDAARRWALVCWALLGAAMLLDWRRRYGDAAWAGDWRWASVHAGTAFAWAGATLLVWVTGRSRHSSAAALAGFAAFTLGLIGLTLRRATGWNGVHDMAGSAAGRALAWGGLVVVVAYAMSGLLARRGSGEGGARSSRGIAARAMAVSHVATLLVAAALVAAGFERVSEVSLREGDRVRVPDTFGTPWTLSLEGVSTVGREAVVANVVAVRAAVNGHARGFVGAEIRSLYSGEGREPVDQIALSGIASGLAQDLKIDVGEASTTDATLTVRFVPGASWIRIAGLAAVLAAFVAAGAAGAAGAAPPVEDA